MSSVIVVKPDTPAMEITFDKFDETDPVVIHDIVSNHIVQADNNCVIAGIKKRELKLKYITLFIWI